MTKTGFEHYLNLRDRMGPFHHRGLRDPERRRKRTVKKYLRTIQNRPLNETKRFSAKRRSARHPRRPRGDDRRGSAPERPLPKADIENQVRATHARWRPTCSNPAAPSAPDVASEGRLRRRLRRAAPPAQKIDVSIQARLRRRRPSPPKRAPTSPSTVDRHRAAVTGTTSASTETTSYVRMKKGERGGWFNRGARPFDVRVLAQTELGTGPVPAGQRRLWRLRHQGGEARINTASGDGAVRDGSFDRIEIASGENRRSAAGQDHHLRRVRRPGVRRPVCLPSRLRRRPERRLDVRRRLDHRFDLHRGGVPYRVRRSRRQGVLSRIDRNARRFGRCRHRQRRQDLGRSASNRRNPFPDRSESASDGIIESTSSTEERIHKWTISLDSERSSRN
ncbi:MAG: hypothetical protein MZU97_14840 [Bacillus subtilis]|nr:hypothetical protein [Bacillus subtilis]